MKPDAWLILYGLSIGGPTAGFILFSFIRQLNTSLLHMLPRQAPRDIVTALELHMDFHKTWQEQCAATRTVRARFGVKSALDYLVGEKLLNFAREADWNPEFAAELPRFQAAV